MELVEFRFYFINPLKVVIVGHTIKTTMNFENKLTIFEKTDTHRPINASKPKREIKQPKWTDNFIS